MGPRSTATRKRKRDTTSQALDLLNGVNSTNNNTRHSLPRISRKPRAPLPRHPRSDDIFNEPSSPEIVPNSQPLTPRRSTRLQQFSPASPTGTRTSLQQVPNSQAFTPRRSSRLQKSSAPSSTHTRRASRDSDTARSSHGADATASLDMREQADPDEQMDEGNEDTGGNIEAEDLNNFSQVNLFSEDEHTPGRSSKLPINPSPSVFTQERFSRESVAQEPVHSDDNSTGSDIPWSRYHTPQPEGDRASLNPQVVVELATGPSDTAMSASGQTAVAVHRTPVSSPKKLRFAGMSSPEQPDEDQLASNAATPTPGCSQEVASDPREDDASHPIDNSESDSSYVTSDSDSAQSSPERDSSPVIASKSRQVVDRNDEIQHSDGRSWEQTARPRRSLSNSTAQSQSDSEDVVLNDFWFMEAKTLGGHEVTWRNLLARIREMKEAASSARGEAFKDIEELISRLKSLYEDGIERLTASRPVPRRIDGRWRILLDRIKESGDLFRSRVYNRLQRQLPSREDGQMLTEFEGRVIARMVDHVLLPSFQVYYQSQGRYDGHFEQVLGLLIHFAETVYSLKKIFVIPCKNRSRDMLRPLKLLLRAMVQRDFMHALYSRRVAQDPHLAIADSQRQWTDGEGYSRRVTQHQHARIETPKRPWTDEEGKVLVAALRKYQGSGRYMTIIAKYGDRLRGRTPHELRAETRRIYDGLLPEIQGKLHLPGIREEYQWLLSVPYD